MAKRNQIEEKGCSLRACLLEMVKFNQHCNTVLFDKKVFNFRLIRLNRFVS
jgi:hypothetical protein